MIDIPQARDLIKNTLERMGPKYASDDAVDLILGTGIIESRFKYFEQMGNGPAKGFFQIESDTAIDNCVNYLKFRPTVADRCVHATYIPKRYWIKPDRKHWEFLLKTNVAAGIVHARIKYWRVPHPMPKTLEGKAKYWKQWYNSEAGSGDPQEYVHHVGKYL
jgi:hypothetical protein